MRIRSLQWDDANLEHIIGKHGLSPNDVEDVCFGAHYAFSVKHNRKAVYGQTASGRYLLVVLQRLYGSVYRVVTARDMTRSERAKFRAVMGRGM